MAIRYSKILSAFTLDSALTLQLDIDDAGAFDVSVAVTVPAGTYFMRWDGQSDDFLRVLHLACYTALDACAVAAYNGADNDGKPMFGINSDHKVTITIGNDLDMRFAWTEDDGATVAGILGFDATASLDVTGGETEVGDYQHAYGWYASAPGQLANDYREDHETAHVAQSRAVGGEVVTQYLSSVFDNKLELRFLDRGDTYSGGADYTDASIDPYERNRPLECWWRSARSGNRFCVYRDSQITTTVAEECGVYTASGLTTLTDAAKSWTIDPQEHAGKLLYVDYWGGAFGGNVPMRYYITSHTATQITAPNSINGSIVGGTGVVLSYRIFDQRYSTYVLDLGKMKTFAPREIESIEKYDIDIPLLRYVA